MRFGFIGQVVSEKNMFENNGHIHIAQGQGLNVVFFININILPIWSFPASCFHSMTF